MGFVFAIATAVAVAALLAVILMIRPKKADRIPTPEWVAEFRVAKYRPMEHLLDERDFAFLAAQAGYEPAIGRQLRRERRDAFAAYLDRMELDFDRLYRAGVQMALSAAHDRPDLSARLMQMKASFMLALFQVRGRLLLNRLGLASVSVAPLIRCLEQMGAATRESLSAPRPALQAF